MEARPLETIPEETVKTPDRVTSDVPKKKTATAKNPGRVASGKRLAELNRLAREAKKQAEAQNPLQTTLIQIKPQTNPAAQTRQITPQATLFWGVCGLIVSALGVYYQREAIVNTLRRSANQTAQPPSSNDAVNPPPAIAKAPKRKNREME